MTAPLVRRIAFAAVVEERQLAAPQLERAVNRALQMLEHRTHHGRVTKTQRAYLKRHVARAWETAA